MAFTNRIIGYGTKAADQFTANPDNPRIHPQTQREAMQAALEQIGWLAPVIENQRTGYLIDGHERVMQALLNNESVPYIQVDLSPDEEMLALATFDPIGELAYYDPAQVNQLLAQITIENPPLQRLLDSLRHNPADAAPETVKTDPDENTPTLCPCCGATI
jgi:hypothetical protein